MLFRIDLEHFLTHMIDYFTLEELISCQYVIVGTISNQGRCTNIVKLNTLYPAVKTILTYTETKDKDILRKEYYDQLKGDCDSVIYNAFVNNVIEHQNIIILCRNEENDWMDILIEYLEKEFSIETLDLNQLFKTGKVGPIHIDRIKIKNKAVDVRRRYGKEMIKSYETTKDGRAKLLDMMDLKYKIKKCKELGIKVNKSDIKNIDEILTEAWVEEEE